jgi:hypothetical protein
MVTLPHVTSRWMTDDAGAVAHSRRAPVSADTLTLRGTYFTVRSGYRCIRLVIRSGRLGPSGLMARGGKS